MTDEEDEFDPVINLRADIIEGKRSGFIVQDGAPYIAITPDLDRLADQNILDLYLYAGDFGSLPEIAEILRAIAYNLEREHSRQEAAKAVGITKATTADELAAQFDMLVNGEARTSVLSDTTAYSLVLHDVGPKKINVIKAIRVLTSLGLRESKDMTEMRLPVTVAVNLTAAQAAAADNDFRQAGATVKIEPEPGTLRGPSANQILKERFNV